MELVQTVKTASTMISAFESAGRENQFSNAALEALHEHLSDLSHDLGEPIEMDVVGLCCEYSEYDTARECAEQYGWPIEDSGIDRGDYEGADCFDDEDEHYDDHGDYFEVIEAAAKEWLSERTSVIDVEPYGVVIQDF